YCSGRYLGNIFEKACIVLNCAVGKAYKVRCAVKGGVWFVETDVSVASQSQNLHVLCVVLQKLMVSCTFLLQVACQTVGQMGVFLRQIHLVEQVAVHKMYITLLVVFSQSDIFVEIDCFHLLERKFLLTAKLRQN